MKLFGRKNTDATSASGDGMVSNSGASAEQYAADWLQNKGLKILARNYRTKLGEIDLIGTENNTLVFVEVRFRKNLNFGLPAETINQGKQRRLIRAARQYLQQHRIDQPCRFDSMSLTKGGGKTAFRVEWLRDAFQLEES